MGQGEGRATKGMRKARHDERAFKPQFLGEQLLSITYKRIIPARAGKLPRMATAPTIAHAGDRNLGFLLKHGRHGQQYRIGAVSHASPSPYPAQQKQLHAWTLPESDPQPH